MTLPEFITLWQAQPFRPFRLHTRRGVLDVTFPLQVALTPAMHLAIALEGARVECLALDEIERAESSGDPVDLAQLISSLPPDLISRTAGLLSAAVQEASPEPTEPPPPAEQHDPGTITFLTATEKDTGIFLIYAVVTTRDGERMFSNVGTRWNVHGVEPFENGTSIYLHHLDHPTLEQRVILWPPDRATFDSFAEATTPEALLEELHRRDAQLTAQPAKPVEPKADYFRRIRPEYPLPPRLTQADVFGEEPNEVKRRYQLEFHELDLGGGRQVRNPLLKDLKTERELFDVRATAWDAEATGSPDDWCLTLRHAAYPGKSFTLTIDCPRHTARIDGGRRPLPLAFIERHLYNFALYAGWDLMSAALRAGPVKRRQPDVVVPLAGGFRAELWAGDRRHPLPFLQPRIVDAADRTVFDLRATPWAAVLHPPSDDMLVTLSFVSHERSDSTAAAHWRVTLDLVTHRVTAPPLDGVTTIGQLQAFVRHVSGTKWMNEALPQLLGKGRLLPAPPRG